MKKTIFIAAAALVAMTACNKTLIETPVSESDYGYINLGITADTEMIVTKAGETEYDSYLVTIKNSSGSAVSGYDCVAYSTIKSAQIKLSAGTYTVEVQNFKAEDLYNDDRLKGAVRVAGTLSSVELAAGETKPITVNCNPVNSMVTVAYAEGFTDVFEDAETKVTGNGKTFTMTTGHQEANAVYYNTNDSYSPVSITKDDNTTTISTGANLTWEMTATVAGVNKKFTGSFNAPAAYWTKIEFAAGDSGIITITISANDDITEEYTIEQTIDPTTGTVVTQ